MKARNPYQAAIDKGRIIFGSGTGEIWEMYRK